MSAPKESFLQNGFDEISGEIAIKKIDPILLKTKIKACLNKIQEPKENTKKTKKSEKLERIDSFERNFYFSEKVND
jgi:hypothetical protein